MTLENERLPVKLGWKKPGILNQTTFTDMLRRVENATDEVSGGAMKFIKRDGVAGLHAILSD